MEYGSRLDRADRQIAIVAFALALAVYLRGVAPDMLTGDSGEFHFATWRWGLAHPTGYPLYLLVGGLWQRVLGVLGISPALALNVFSAVMAALAVALLYLLMRRWLWEVQTLGRIAAIWTAFFLAVNPTFWSQSLIAEVYALHALFVLAIFFVAQDLIPPQVDAPPAPSAPADAADDHAARITPTLRPGRLALLAFVTGLSLTHHGMTLLLAPGLLLTITLLDPGWWRNWRNWAAGVTAFTLPLLLYFYIPLRSGPTASPWYHQRLGDGTLTLYDGGRQAFADFVTGRAISVGFYDWTGAWNQLGRAATLWRIHFEWAGLVLIVVGVTVLVWRRNWPVLALTLPYFILQQLFNLFYAIDDILVYYIPLYLIGTIWGGFGAYGLATGVRPIKHTEIAAAASDDDDENADEHNPKDAAENSALGRQALGAIALVLLFWLPLNQWSAYSSIIDQSQNRQARTQWDAILAAEPPPDAILVSNDRNEIVPLFYLQAVEEQAAGMTGLFPLIAPDERFTDIAATVDTALTDGGEQPVFLIKAMPGLETKFELAPATPPLVEVLGPAAEEGPEIVIGRDYGPLTLLGYDWTPIAATVDGKAGTSVAVDLHWQVNEQLNADYTTTLQIFNAAGEKLAQDDRPPGGDYYPTSLWKPGEVLLDRHELFLPAADEAASLLIDLYTGADFASPAEPLRIDFTTRRCKLQAQCE